MFKNTRSKKEKGTKCNNGENIIFQRMKTKQGIISSLHLIGMVAPTNNNINFSKEDDSGLTISTSNIHLTFPL